MPKQSLHWSNRFLLFVRCIGYLHQYLFIYMLASQMERERLPTRLIRSSNTAFWFWMYCVILRQLQYMQPASEHWHVLEWYVLKRQVCWLTIKAKKQPSQNTCQLSIPREFKSSGSSAFLHNQLIIHKGFFFQETVLT